MITSVLEIIGRARRPFMAFSAISLLAACTGMPLKDEVRTEVDQDTGKVAAVKHGQGSDELTGKDSTFGLTGDTSDTGAGGIAAYWQHSNLGGNGNTVRVSAIAGMNEFAGEVSGKVPMNQQWDMVGKLRGRYFTSDAYEQTGGEGMLGLAYNASPQARITPYVTAEYADVEDWHGDYSPMLGGAGVLAELDTTDDPSDPKTGIRVRAKAAYYMGETPGIVDDEVGFLLGDLHASGYYSLDRAGNFVLAGRGRVAVTEGEDRDDMPATKRLYTGSVGTVNGGQVRGYAFQGIGPQLADGTPLGGTSVVETSVEMRMRLHEKFGVVPFIDGGGVYSDTASALGQDEEFRWAGGVGLRYYSQWGILRADVATPINGRDNDDDFQVYVGMGQAF